MIIILRCNRCGKCNYVSGVLNTVCHGLLSLETTAYDNSHRQVRLSLAHLSLVNMYSRCSKCLFFQVGPGSIPSRADPNFKVDENHIKTYSSIEKLSK